MKKLLPVAARIRTARTQARLSQKELGEKVQLSDKAISAYEVGRAQPSVSVLQDISEATGRPLAYFLDEADHEELDLVYRLKTIDRELHEIKKALRSKGYELS